MEYTYVFKRYSETTKRSSTYEVVAESEAQAREKLAKRHGATISEEADLVVRKSNGS
jgi:hypothetical protein